MQLMRSKLQITVCGTSAIGAGNTCCDLFRRNGKRGTREDSPLGVLRPQLGNDPCRGVLRELANMHANLCTERKTM